MSKLAQAGDSSTTCGARAKPWASATAFSIENMHKDLGICQRMAKESEFSMPGMENAKRVYDECMAEGIGKEDFRATFKAVRGDF